MSSPAAFHETPDTHQQIWRYAVTGLINTGLGLFVILTLHVGLNLGLVLSNAVGYGIGILCSFTLNRSWTFSSQANILPAGVKYLITVGIAFAFCILVVTRLQAVNAPYLVAQIMGTSLYSIIVFLGAKYVVFTR
ncbi:MAG: GtrA family protein [Octadecabacter sp.]